MAAGSELKSAGKINSGYIYKTLKQFAVYILYLHTHTYTLKIRSLKIHQALVMRQLSS